MKKTFLVVLLTLLSFTYGSLNLAKADTLVYPFDSITIVEAFKFDVVAPTTISTESLLYDVVIPGETLTIYVGSLEFMLDGVPASGSSEILIVTDEDGNDLFKFLINNWSFYEGVSTFYGFASHILIDPEVGVYKLLDQGSEELSVTHNLVDDTWSFMDNAATTMDAIVDTYQFETGLSIVISAYTEDGE